MRGRSGTASCKIGDLCDLESGNGFRPQDWSSEGLPIIRIQNLNGSPSFNFFSGQINPRWIVEPGDLLFAWAGVKGVSFGPTIWKGPKGVLNQHIFRVRPRAGIDKQWLYYALSQVTVEIESKAHGFKRSLVHVRKSDITRARVARPSESEQVALATVLGYWDTAITKTEQLIAAKRRFHGALSNTLLFGLARFGLPRASTTKKLHWFRISSAWHVTEIGRVAEQVSITASNEPPLPVLSCTKHHGLVDSLTYFKKQVFSRDTSKYKLVRQGQFAYATNHIEEGSIGYLDFVPAGLVSPIYTVFQADGSRIDDGYLYKLLKTERLRQLFSARTNASVDRRGSLRWKEFARIRIPLPPLEEQRRISAFLDEAKWEIDLLEAEAEAMKMQKRGLMQKLLTGEWRLPLPPAAQAKETP